MPLFDYRCSDCSFKKEHFVYNLSAVMTCPKCESTSYKRMFGKFRVDVQYANTNEYVEKKLNPEVRDLYNQIGQEALNEDSQTLDNLFGTEKVADTYADTDD